MWGAAPRRQRILSAFVLAAGIVPGAAAANTASQGAAHAPAPERIWAVQVGSRDLTWLDSGHIARLRQAGINMLVVDRRRTDRGPLSKLRLRAAAGHLQLTVIGNVRDAVAGRALLAQGERDVVSAARNEAAGAAGTRVMLLVPLKGPFSRDAWLAAIRATIAHGRDLAVVTESRSSNRFSTLAPFLSLLASVDKSAPTRPTRLRVVDDGSTTVRVTWSRSTDRNRVRYRVFRSGKLTTTVTTLSAKVTPPDCTTTYSVSVVAVDPAGNVSQPTTTKSSCKPNKTIAGTSPPADALPPAPILGLAASVITSTSIGISWTASTDNVAVTGYAVYRDDVAVASTAGTSFTHTGLVCGTSYRLAVVAFDAAGNRSQTTSTTATTLACTGGGGGGGGGGGTSTDTQPPTAPSGLSVTQSLAASITLSWQPATDNVAVTGYGAYRNGSLVSTASGTTFTFNSLACGTTYTLGVDAVDAAGTRSTISTRTATTASCPPGGDTQPPTSPTALTVAARTTTSITLSWTASTDNQALAGYGVYRGGTSVGSPTTTSFMFTGLACATSYGLGVDAFDATGNRSSQAPITASTSACPDTTPPSAPGSPVVAGTSATSISLSWSTSIDNVGVTGYRVLRNGTALGTAALTAYTFTGLSCNTTYTLAVDAFDAAGNHSTASSLSATTSACADSNPPSVPASLTKSGATTTSVSLTWSASTDNVAVAGYGVYRAGTLLASPTGTSYTITGLACGTTYSVGVDAFDAAGNRSATSSISAATSTCTAGDTAHVWVDGSGGSCLRQATAGAYVDAQACGSLDAAYQAAAAGDMVRIKGGSYGDQTINVKSGAAGPNRVFAAASGETVSFHDVTEEDADYVTLQGPMTLHRLDLTATLNAVVDGLTIAYNYTDQIDPIVFIGGKSTGGRTSNGVVIRNSDISGAWDQKNVMIDDSGGSVSNVLLDRNDIHSQKMSDASVHMECLWITDADGVTVRGNRVWGCHGTGDVIIGNSAGGPGATNILFENNVFETSYSTGTDECCTATAFTIQTGAFPASTWTFQYNLFESPVVWQPGMTVRGNLGIGGSCASGVAFAYNLWTDIDCGTDTKNTAALNASQFVNSAAHNWRPAGVTSSQIDRGDPGTYPSTDADSLNRPTGNAPDAGAYEYH